MIRRPLLSLLISAITTTLALLTSGCLERAVTPREHARSVVLVMTEAIHEADLACATLARAKDDKPLARECVKAYDDARDGIVGLASAVDAWDAGKESDVACGIAHASTSLRALLAILERRGARAPPIVIDALKLAPSLAGACHGRS